MNKGNATDDNGRLGSQTKKRRVPGACDVCKRRKSECLSTPEFSGRRSEISGFLFGL